MLDLEQNYNIFCEIGLEVDNGIIKDQDTGEMIKNYVTGKYLIDYVPNTRVNWNYYEDFNPYFNFKQLKILTEYYLNKVSILDDRNFKTFCTDIEDGKICLVAKSEQEEVRSGYYEKEQTYLAYIDFIFRLSGYIEDMTLYTLNREELGDNNGKSK